MSRTDAHAPLRVRVARREITVLPVHYCGDRDCDLPYRITGLATRCHWQFLYTGTNVCSCWMCHEHRRPEIRRSTVRARLHDLARLWNGEDREA
jgi:hypothetical protein